MRGIDLVALRGGVGNQLFAWAYGYTLGLEGARVRYSFVGQYGRAQLIKPLAKEAGLIYLPEGIWRRLVAPSGSLTGLVPVVHETGGGLGRSGLARLHWGYWQTAAPIERRCAEIKLRLDTWLGADSQAPERDVCAIHIRRTDYVTDPGASDLLGILPDDYYHAAIDRMAGRGFRRFRFYSDDPDWVRTTWSNAPRGLSFEYAPRGSTLDDLRRIASSGALVSANSTFSWWAGFLGYPKSTVIIPRRWFKYDDAASTRLAISSWERL